jgi:hypothetical protein
MQDISLQEVIDFVLYFIPVIFGIIYTMMFILTVGLPSNRFYHNYWDLFYIVRMIALNMLCVIVSALSCAVSINPKEMFFSIPNLIGFILYVIIFVVLVVLYTSLISRLEKNGLEIRCDLHKRPF